MELSGGQVLGDDTACTTVNDDQFFHLVAGEEFHFSCFYLCAQ